MRNYQYFDIKYPFTNKGIEKYELDLNGSKAEQTASDILHLIFTPKGQRLRLPEYGTDLMKFIFEQNTEEEWDGVKREIQDSVSTWIDGATIDNIQVASSEDGIEIFVRVDYSIKEGNYVYKNSIAVEI